MRKISLKDLYEERKKAPNPAKQLIEEIARITNRSELTVRLWISGHHVPEAIITKVIADHFHIDPDYIFP